MTHRLDSLFHENAKIVQYSTILYHDIIYAKRDLAVAPVSLHTHDDMTPSVVGACQKMSDWEVFEIDSY